MKAKRIILFFLLLSALIPTPLINADPGWLAGWNKRVKITIDAGDVDTPLTDFPILIYLSDSSGINAEDLTFVFDEVGANSLKIAVTEDDGLTELYVEIEKWDLGNEKAWLWAKIASISNTTDTDLYLYYDNDHADNTNKIGLTNSIPAENVWNSNFKLVQHMNAPSSPIVDSTDEDNDGAQGGNPTYQQDGKINDAIAFDGNDEFECGDDADLKPQILTLEVWVKTTDYTRSLNGGTAYGWVFGGATYFAYKIDFHGGNARFMVSNGVSSSSITNVAIDDNNWHYYVLTYSNPNLRAYKDGAETGSSPKVGSITIDYVLASADDFMIGARVGGQYGIDGMIDEVRFSSGSARSTAWIKASYESGRDDFLDYGTEEEPPLPLETPAYLFGAGFNASIPFVNLRWASNLTNIDFFEIQNSTDKITWEYLGQSPNNSYNDFQVVNGTERYYRVRACNFTGAAWDNTSFTDIDFETVYYEIGGAPGPAPSLFPGLAIGIAILIIAYAYSETRR